MSLLVVVLVFLLAPARSWVINTSTDEIVPGVTNEMWLECRQTSAVDKVHKIKTVEKFVITKYNACGGKTSVTDIDQNNDIRTFSPEAKFTVTGDVLDDTSKFLRLTWSDVDVEDAGRYGCEVEGFDDLGNEINIRLKPKVIKVKELTIAVVKKLVQAIKDEYDFTHNRLKSEIENKHNRLQSEIENNMRIQSEMEKKFNSEMANLTNLMKGCQCQPPTEPPTSPPVTSTTTTPPVVTTNPTVKTTPKIDDDQWPLGKYNIIISGPEYPCPALNSSDVHSKRFRDYFQYKVVIASTNELLCRCTLDVSKSSRPTWPKGSYCIEYYGECPTSFTLQYADDPVFSSYSYCCRSDGNTSNEIHLPTKTPYYLLTDKSNVCQQVKGMNVTQTYVVYKAYGTYKFKGGKKRRGVNSPRLCHYQPV